MDIYLTEWTYGSHAANDDDNKKNKKILNNRAIVIVHNFTGCDSNGCAT